MEEMLIRFLLLCGLIQSCHGYFLPAVMMMTPTTTLPHTATSPTVSISERGTRSQLRQLQQTCCSRRKALTGLLGGIAGLAVVSRTGSYCKEGGGDGTAWADDVFNGVSRETPLPASGKGKIGKRGTAPLENVQFTTLPSGVKVKEFKEGGGEATVQAGSTVYFQATGRMLNLNGAKFFSSKDDVADELAGPLPLIVRIGKGVLIPGLEEGMIGMKKGGIRRVIIPPALGYAAGVNLEPQPRTLQDRNALNGILKNPNRDATVLFDLQIERIK